MSAGNMVSGRIPVELRRRGDAALSDIGSTPSKLIRAAYEYIVKTGSLPAAPQDTTAHHHSLSSQKRKELLVSVRESTLSIPSSCFKGKTDKELLEESLLEKYGEGLPAL